MAKSEEIAPGMHIFQQTGGRFWYVRINTGKRRKAWSLRTESVIRARRRAYQMLDECSGDLDALFDRDKPKATTARAKKVMAHYAQAMKGVHKDNTIDDKLRIIRLFYREYSSTQTVWKTKQKDVDAFVRRRDIAQDTRRGYYIRLAAFFAWCIENKYMEESPLAKVQKPRTTRKLPEFFTEDEFQRFVASIKHEADTNTSHQRAKDPYWFYDLVQFAVATGMRINEIRHLRWRDVGENEFMLRGYGDYTLKTWQERTVPIFDAARRILDVRQGKRRTNDPNETVFVGQRGRPFSTSLANKYFRRHKELTGVNPKTKFHSLRKTFGTWCVRNHIPIQQVQVWMGHRDYETTLIYASVGPTAYAEEANAIFK